jgi:hypothetical protein
MPKAFRLAFRPFIFQDALTNQIERRDTSSLLRTGITTLDRSRIRGIGGHTADRRAIPGVCGKLIGGRTLSNCSRSVAIKVRVGQYD